MILVLRIAGRVKNKKKDEETLKRLNLEKKFSMTAISESDKVRVGMIKSVSHMVAYCKVSDDFLKVINSKRKPNEKNVYFLHPPIGGFKKSTKLEYPRGVLGYNKDLIKLIEKML